MTDSSAPGKARSASGSRGARGRRVSLREKRFIGWRFELMDDDLWPFPSPTDDLYIAFLESLNRIGGVPFDAWDSPAHKEPLANLASAAQDRLRELGIEEGTGGSLSKFQVSEIADRARMWAIQKDNVYFLLWWDPDHEVENAAPSRGLRKRRKRS